MNCSGSGVAGTGVGEGGGDEGTAVGVTLCAAVGEGLAGGVAVGDARGYETAVAGPGA